MKRFTVQVESSAAPNPSFYSYIIDDTLKPQRVLAVSSTVAWTTETRTTPHPPNLDEIEAALAEGDLALAAKIAEKAGLRVTIQAEEQAVLPGSSKKSRKNG